MVVRVWLATPSGRGRGYGKPYPCNHDGATGEGLFELGATKAGGDTSNFGNNEGTALTALSK